MSKTSKAQPKKQTAAQRIEALEQQFLASIQNNQILAGELDNLRQTMAALARRLNATIKSGEQGEISNDLVNQLLVEENTAELKGKIDYLLEQGVLEEAKEEAIHQKSFVIGRELDEEKNVINPRIQFALVSIAPEIQESLMGKKVGDVIVNEQDGLSLEVVELLDIAEKVEKNLSDASQEAAEQA